MGATTADNRSQVLPVLALVAVAGACWAVTVQRMWGMDMGPGTHLGGLGWFAVVWVTMMAAMMLPSFAPMCVAYARASGRGQAGSLGGVVVFAAGYLLTWAAFGVLAYALVEGGALARTRLLGMGPRGPVPRRRGDLGCVAL